MPHSFLKNGFLAPTDYINNNILINVPTNFSDDRRINPWGRSRDDMLYIISMRLININPGIINMLSLYWI